jgi:hypothetical protein
MALVLDGDNGIVGVLTTNTDGDVIFDTDTLFVDAPNNSVGIGTLTPSTKLHVDGGGSSPEIRIAQNSTYYTDIGINHIDVYNNDLRIMMGGSEKWRFKSGGDLYASSAQEVKSGNKSSIGYEAFFGANSLRFNRDGNSYIDTRGTNNNLKFRHNSNYDTAMTILGSNGNVGIGDNDPVDTAGFGTALDINGTNGAALYLRDNTDGKIGTIGQWDEELSIHSRNASGTIKFYINNSPKFKITSSGTLEGTSDAEIATSPIRTHSNTISTNTTIDANDNAVASGPLGIADGVTLTINGNMTVV